MPVNYTRTFLFLSFNHLHTNTYMLVFSLYENFWFSSADLIGFLFSIQKWYSTHWFIRSTMGNVLWLSKCDIRLQCFSHLKCYFTFWRDREYYLLKLVNLRNKFWGCLKETWLESSSLHLQLLILKCQMNGKVGCVSFCHVQLDANLRGTCDSLWICL